jgi:cardiolipin synthase A/B
MRGLHASTAWSGRLQRVRRALIIGGSVLGALVAVVAFWAWFQILHIQEHSTWPPVGGVTSAGAEAATEALVADPHARPSDCDLSYAPSTAATSEPWVDGDTFFPRILDDIAKATSSVHILMYGWKDGQVGRAFTDAVTAKAAEGVEVRIIVDAYGSQVFDGSQAMFDDLVAAGAHIVVNDSLPLDREGELGSDRSIDWRQDEVGQMDHRKLYVIDGTIAWTGGAGIETHFYDGRFHDVMTRVTGAVVRQTQAAFLTSFHAYGGTLPTGSGALAPYFPEPAEVGTIPAVLTQNLPGGFVNSTQQARELVDTATRRLDVVNPYLTDDDMIDRIAAASARGVEVRLFVSENSNNPTTQHALEHDYASLQAAGVVIYEYPGAVVHAKVIVSDERASIGTLNLDAWAMYRNSEIVVTVTDPQTVALLDARLFGPDVAKSSLAQPPEGVIERTKAWFADVISYFI